MQYNNSKFGFGIDDNNPLTHNLYNQGLGEGDAPVPPSSSFIISETSIYIVTESGDKLITE
jgi:hypothetical protein